MDTWITTRTSLENLIGSMDLNDAKISVPMKKGFCFELDVNTLIASPPSSPSRDGSTERRFSSTGETKDVHVDSSNTGHTKPLDELDTNKYYIADKSDDTVSDESNRNEIRALKDATRRVSQYSSSGSLGSMKNVFRNEEDEEEQQQEKQ